jgi:hypothetical protein
VREQGGGPAKKAARRRVEGDSARAAANGKDAAEEFVVGERGISARERVALGDENGARVVPGFADDPMGEETFLADEENNVAGMNAGGGVATHFDDVAGAQPGPHAAAKDAERNRAAGTKNLGEQFDAEAVAGGRANGDVGFHGDILMEAEEKAKRKSSRNQGST